jgi:hypothetical protein
VARGAFDNSSLNPANPDPARAVYFGPQTFEEMFLGYMLYTVPRQNPVQAAALSSR